MKKQGSISCYRLVMLLKRKLPLLFMLTLGILLYGVIAWKDSFLYSIHKDFWLNSPLETVHSNGSSEYSSPTGITNYEKHSSKSETNIQFPSHSDVLSSSSGNIGKTNLLMEMGSTQGQRNETKLNPKEMDEKVKQSEIDNLVSIVSRLSKIKESHSYMTMMRNTLNNLSHVPSLPHDFVNKSEGSLWSTVVPPGARVTYSDTWNGYRLPVITCHPAGRLGNVMGEYATVYVLQQVYNVTVLNNDVLIRSLSDFPFLSLTKVPGKYDIKEWKHIGKVEDRYNYTPIELAAAGLFGPHRFVLTGTSFEVQLFHKYQKELKQEFMFSTKIAAEVQNFLKFVAENRTIAGHSDIVFVGFHVRRTDYATYVAQNFKGILPGEAYFNRAMDYYRIKFHKRVVFIAASDDLPFLKKKIGNHTDVFFSPGTSAAMDLAVLSSCNHSIITLGTYGFLTGFLAGGEVVYPDIKFPKEYKLSRPSYEKIGLTYFTPLSVD